MIGIILIYFIGKAYYDLAKLHKRSTWPFAILGVITYYLGSFIGGIVLVFIYELLLMKSIETVPDIQLSLMAVPFGGLFCWALYKILKNSWSKKAKNLETDSIDSDFIS